MSTIGRRRKREPKSDDPLTTLTAQNNAPNYSLTESWETHFFPFFLYNVEPGQVLAEDVYDIIPQLFRHTRPSSAFYQACNAVARKFLARRLHSSKALADDLEAHSKIINVIQSAIRNSQKVKSDDTLLAIWLLGVYEVSLLEIGQPRRVFSDHRASSFNGEESGPKAPSPCLLHINCMAEQ